jgi:alkaline phosphatase D
VVIWSRVTPGGDGPVPVRWIVARDQRLRNVVQSGDVTTGPERDYTIKIDVAGLSPDTAYYFGFSVGRKKSPVGKTHTVPRSGAGKLVIGVVSCSHHGFGFFNAYEALSKRKDLDLVLHLGDYIYEYGVSGFGGQSALALGRLPRPEIECVTLGDYRMRHAQYKEEPELQALHAACPWIVTWDDHEIANDSWIGGAENHNPEQNEGDWTARKKAALQAYYEWMPIREPEAGKPMEAINRSFQFGDLATIIMLETRLTARTQPLSYAKDLPLASTLWEFANPAAPTPLAKGQTGSPLARAFPTPFEAINSQLTPILDWARVRALDPRNPPPGIFYVPDVEAFKAGVLSNPQRMLLGAAQEAWLQQQIDASVKQRTTWQVLGNQTLMAKINAPDLSGLAPAVVAEVEKLQPGAAKLLQLTKLGIPMSLDGWDGYPVQRARVAALLKDANAIVLTGDSHAAWANEIVSADGKTRAAVEFGTTSITSAGFGDFFAGGGVDLNTAVPAANPEVKWHDAIHRGYLVLTLTRAEAKAEFVTVSDVRAKDFETATAATFRVKSSAKGKPGAVEKL